MSKTKRWDFLNASFLWGTLVLAMVLVPIQLALHGLAWSEVLVCLGMVFFVGTAISGGYHRLFAHRAYEASKLVKFFYLLFGAASFENSALKWASDHRLHHRQVDDEGDPYTIGKGFWYAHWIWAMEAKEPAIQGVTDLKKDPLIMWQHRNHFLIGACVASIPLWIGLATGNFWGHFVMGILLRIVLTHHTTFLINSAAHRFGQQTYSDTNSSRDNPWLAPLTYGEGYHNFHHTWQWDYRNGVKWYHWDSTKWLLNILAWAGLVKNLRRVPPVALRRARLCMEEKTLRERLVLTSPAVARPIQVRLAEARLKLDAALAALHERHEAWRIKQTEWKVNRARRRAEQWKAIKAEWQAILAQHREELKAAWQEWQAARMEVRSALVYA